MDVFQIKLDFAQKSADPKFKKIGSKKLYLLKKKRGKYDRIKNYIKSTKLTYSYDPAGNRLSENSSTYTYNAMNELLSITDGTTFTYDDNGNTLTKTKGTDTYSYTYDKKNSLTQVEKNQRITEHYYYDGDGKRIEKTEWVESLQEYQTIIYVYFGLDILYEKNLNTGLYATYVYGLDGRIAKKVGGTTDYYHTDHLRSTRLITDGSGNTVTEVTYTPFGETTLTGEDTPYLYTGKERDTTGLYYYGARYYDPEIGRFTTRDPNRGTFDNPGTLNRYTYCLNNPLKYTDPNGRETANCGPYSWYDKDGERYSSLRWAFIRSQFMQWKHLGLMCVKYYNWAEQHGSMAALLTTLGPIGAGAVAGTGVGALVGILFGAMYIAADQYYADLWNDPQFVELWNVMEKYLNMLVEGYDCEQEFNDACCELAVYLLQKKYGDNWRDHADPELLKYYDEMQTRKNQSSPPSNPPGSPPPSPPSNPSSAQID